MNREVHVRFCESRGVRFPPATRLAIARATSLCLNRPDRCPTQPAIEDFCRTRGPRLTGRAKGMARPNDYRL